MKPQELKREFVRLRGEGQSYQAICDQLHIAKGTCTKWEQEFSKEIADLKRAELNELYTSYHMTKEARIKELGEALGKIDNALAQTDLSNTDPAKLLDFKLKYTEALKTEYIGTEPAFRFGEHIDANDIVLALGDLLNRIRAGEVPPDQANKESLVLSNLLKAYDIVEVKSRLDKLEAIVGGR